MRSWCGCRLQLLPEVLLQLLRLLLLLELLLGLTLWVGVCRLLLLYHIAPGTSAAPAPCSAAVSDFAAANLRLHTPSCMPANALQLVHCCIALALRHPLRVVTCKQLPQVKEERSFVLYTCFTGKNGELQLKSTLAHSVSAVLRLQRCASR
jgi:hypothetical protein